MNKGAFYCERLDPSSCLRNDHRYKHGVVVHLQAPHLRCARPNFPHTKMWRNGESAATNIVTERNRELVVQGLCVEEKKPDLSGKLMLIDTLFHASIFQETQSPLTDDGRTGRVV